MFLATDVRLELEQRAGGPVAQNVGHVYTLTTEEKDYLASLDVDADALLSEMNDRPKIEAPHSSRRYVERFADYTGRITGPVLTVHTIGDGTLPTYHGTAYRELVESVGRGALLAQVYTNGGSHCLWEPEQLQAAADAMVAWLETGVRPDSNDFPSELGFLPDFEPGPFPQSGIATVVGSAEPPLFAPTSGERGEAFVDISAKRPVGVFNRTCSDSDGALVASLRLAVCETGLDAADYALTDLATNQKAYPFDSLHELEWVPELLVDLLSA
jgi:hypothetical protein